MRILLDKGVIRRVLEGFTRVANQQTLTTEQQGVLNYFRKNLSNNQLYISNKSYHTLVSRFGHLEIVQTIFAMVDVLYPTRYARRWARKLRKLGFGREDALIISLGSFSTNKPYRGRILGVDKIVTLDKRMFKRYQANYDTIRVNFEKTVISLTPPFDLAKLPVIETVSNFYHD